MGPRYYSYSKPFVGGGGGGESPCLHILIDLAPECGRVIDLPDDLFLS